MKPRKKRLAAAGLVIVGALGLAAWLDRGRESDPEELTLYGNVDIREVELGFRVSGRLREMAVDEGDAVSSGQRLALIDPEPYQQELAAAEARVLQARAKLDKLRAGSRPQEVQRARARVREAKAAFRNAEREFTRQSGLFEAGVGSEKVRDAARADRDAAEARLASAREALTLAEEGFRAEDVAAGEAELAAAVARRDQARTQLSDTELFAPSNGTVISRVREPGSILSAGLPVYTLSLRDPVYVRAYVSEPELGKLAPGVPVLVTTDSSRKTYRAQVGFISPRAEFTPKSVETVDLRTDLVYRLRIVVQDADEGLRQGMPVTVRVPAEPEPG